MSPRRSPLGSLSLLYSGFVLLVLVSQLSGHLLANAVTAYGATGAQLHSIGLQSTDLAYAASALGLAFSVAVILTVRKRLDPELGVYRASGLPARSALRLVLTSHPVIPVASALATGAVAWAVDLSLGLDGAIPALLALVFASTLVLWLTGQTLASFSKSGPGETRRGRSA